MPFGGDRPKQVATFLDAEAVAAVIALRCPQHGSAAQGCSWPWGEMPPVRDVGCA